jgi:predicted metal-dependent hydrolase
MHFHFYRGRMSRKSERIREWVRQFEGQELDAYYLGFLDFFNRQQFYEAHEILEVLWLPARKSPDDAFYRGLIQLAGAFVHLQKDRILPAVALFRLAQANLARYSDGHRRLDVAGAIDNIANWLAEFDGGQFLGNPLNRKPKLILRLK